MASQEPIYRHLTDDGLAGDGSNHVGNVNGVVTPVPFWYGPTTGKVAIHTLIIAIADAANFSAENYGGVGTLANGITAQIVQGHPTTGVVELDLLDGDPIHSVINWGEHAYDVVYHAFGQGQNFVTCRWILADAGRPIILDSYINEKLVITVNDDLTALTDHQFHIAGHVINEEGHQQNTWGS